MRVCRCERGCQSAARGSAYCFLNTGDVLKGFKKRNQCLSSYLAKSLLTTAQWKFNAYFVAFLKEFFRERFSELPIVLSHLKGDPYAFDLNFSPLFLQFAFLLVLFILILPIIQQTADGRSGRCINFYQVQFRNTCLPERFVNGYHADLLAVAINKTDRLGPDTFIDTMRWLGDESPAKAGAFRNGSTYSRMNRRRRISSGYMRCQCCSCVPCRSVWGGLTFIPSAEY